uniref:Uncharacterized protein n=1 Tax=Cacopsylla melanoneura TaxID=428564 RepID=A0A8D8TUE2_9HEMI
MLLVGQFTVYLKARLMLKSFSNHLKSFSNLFVQCCSEPPICERITQRKHIIQCNTFSNTQQTPSVLILCGKNLLKRKTTMPWLGIELTAREQGLRITNCKESTKNVCKSCENFLNLKL